MHDHDIVHRDLKFVIALLHPRSASSDIYHSGLRTYYTAHQRSTPTSSLRTLECASYQRVSVYQVLTPTISAKHLHTPEEQLHSLAGSFGYVAPEVLNKKGHGKAVDIWSTGYVRCQCTSFARFRKILIEDWPAQNHHLRHALWLLSVPFGRRQGADPRNHGGEGRIPRAVLE